MNDRTFHAANAHRLDDPERLQWLPPADVLQSLKITPGMSIADVGAGTGYFSVPMAIAVGPSGKVYAVDLQEEMLKHLGDKVAAMPAPPAIAAVHGEASKTTLPGASVDIAFYANVWHELDGIEQVLKEAGRIMRPDGRLAILDWREDRTPPPGPPADHRLGPETVRHMLIHQGWVPGEIEYIGKYSYLIIAAPHRS